VSGLRTEGGLEQASTAGYPTSEVLERDFAGFSDGHAKSDRQVHVVSSVNVSRVVASSRVVAVTRFGRFRQAPVIEKVKLTAIY
jgi:hypothetical protein